MPTLLDEVWDTPRLIRFLKTQPELLATDREARVIADTIECNKEWYWGEYRHRMGGNVPALKSMITDERRNRLGEEIHRGR